MGFSKDDIAFAARQGKNALAGVGRRYIGRISVRQMTRQMRKNNPVRGFRVLANVRWVHRREGMMTEF